MTWKPDICLYHHPCHDGFAAAWAVWKRWPDVEFIGVNYGQLPPMNECMDKNVLIVDFSYPADSLRALSGTAETIVILDHHRTAEQELAEFKIGLCGNAKFVAADLAGMFADLVELRMPPIMAEFDMDRSGARMAWDFCHPGEPAPDLIRFIEDRDLWRFQYPETRPLHFLLSTVDQTFDAWDAMVTWFQRERDGTMLRAMAIERYHDQKVADAAKYAGRIEIAGHDVPIANAPPWMASDLGHELAKGEPFAVIWWETWSDGQAAVQFSLRSSDDGEDVSAIAKQFGGGGHRNAAGFRLKGVAGELLFFAKHVDMRHPAALNMG